MPSEKYLREEFARLNKIKVISDKQVDKAKKLIKKIDKKGERATVEEWEGYDDANNLVIDFAKQQKFVAEKTKEYRDNAPPVTVTTTKHGFNSMTGRFELISTTTQTINHNKPSNDDSKELEILELEAEALIVILLLK